MSEDTVAGTIEGALSAARASGVLVDFKAKAKPKPKPRAKPPRPANDHDDGEPLDLGGYDADTMNEEYASRRRSSSSRSSARSALRRRRPPTPSPQSAAPARGRPGRRSPAAIAVGSATDHPWQWGDAMLYQLGALTFDCPGPVNADETTEEFGQDYAVKAVVGAQQPREAVGPSDHKFTLAGELLPYFHQGLGIGSGLNEVETLKAMAASGEPQILVRGDGYNMGWWLVERGSLKSSRLSHEGIGHVIHYSVSLVESPRAPSAASLFGLIEQLFA